MLEELKPHIYCLGGYRRNQHQCLGQLVSSSSYPQCSDLAGIHSPHTCCVDIWTKPLWISYSNLKHTSSLILPQFLLEASSCSAWERSLQDNRIYEVEGILESYRLTYLQCGLQKIFLLVSTLLRLHILFLLCAPLFFCYPVSSSFSSNSHCCLSHLKVYSYLQSLFILLFSIFFLFVCIYFSLHGTNHLPSTCPYIRSSPCLMVSTVISHGSKMLKSSSGPLYFLLSSHKELQFQ